MSTNAPESRKTHITRIFGTNKAGDRLEDMWVDVERMDIVKSAHQMPPDLQWQGLQRTFHWCDDPNADDYEKDGTPSRKLEILKVCDVENEDDPNNPQEWVPVKVVKGIKSRNESGMDYNGGGAMDRFIASVTADELTSARDIKVRRIVHYDTNQDDLIEAATDADPDLREYVVQSSDYIKDQETKDKDQYVEHEIIKSLKSKGNTTLVNGQGSQTHLLNQYLIDESEEATQKIVGLHGYNPPYRLDPFQNIINVNLGASAVEFEDGECIEIDDLINKSKKFTISLWFRVPQISVNAAKQAWDIWFASDDRFNPATRAPLLGIVPLVTIGSKPTRKGFDFDLREIGMTPTEGTYGWFGGPVCGWVLESLNDGSPALQPSQPALSGYYKFNSEIFHDIDPSYIGIDCTGPLPRLSVNIVMPDGNKATYKGSWPVATSYVSDDTINIFGTVSPADAFCTPSQNNELNGPDTLCGITGHHVSVIPFNSFSQTTTYEGGGNIIYGCRPENFRTIPRTGNGEGGDQSEGFLVDPKTLGKVITTDKWHHLLLTVDLTNGVKTVGIDTIDPDAVFIGTEGERTTSACHMGIALDDVNLTKKQLSQYWPSGFSDNNAVLSVGGMQTADYHVLSHTTDPQDNCYGTIVTGTEEFELPTYSYSPPAFPFSKIGFPASTEYVDAVHDVALAEFQLFTGVTVDTSDKKVRRAFVSKNGKPVGMGAAAKLMGKKPEVKISRAANWKEAKNTGTAGGDDGSFGEVIGEIETFKPNPKLGK